MSPYATVIIPTHDRAATLAFAVASVQRQSISDIEILIVGDGPTPDVVEAAEALTRMDSRVRFLPFEKAPTDGGLNIDRAIHQARSERIFYNDDDDVWLPQHIEILGPALDHAHIADTLPASVGVISIGGEQRLHGTLVNSGDDRIRQLLAQGRLKLTFDTHIAHRKSSYADLGNPRAATDGLSVNALLAAFASGKSIRWTTLPTVTALSLHGAARVGATALERRTEIETWLGRSASWTPASLLERLDFTWHLVRTLLTATPCADDSVSDYLARYGIAWDTASVADADIDRPALAIPLNSLQRQAIELAFARFQGRLGGEEPADSVVLSLLDCVLGGTSVPLALRILAPHGEGAALDICARIRRRRPDAGFLVDLLEAYLTLRGSRNKVEARATAERLASDRRLPPYDRTRLFVECDLVEGARDAAIHRLQQAWLQKTTPAAAGLELAQLLIGAARVSEATAICRDLKRRISEPSLEQMAAKLDRMWAELQAVPQYRLSTNDVLLGPNGSAVNASNQINGVVDAMHFEGEFVFFLGWAADLRLRQPVQQVVVMVDGKATGAAKPALSRPDVAAALGLPNAEMSGYLMAARLPAEPTTDIRVFAIAAGGAQELKLPTSHTGKPAMTRDGQSAAP